MMMQDFSIELNNKNKETERKIKEKVELLTVNIIPLCYVISDLNVGHLNHTIPVLVQ